MKTSFVSKFLICIGIILILFSGYLVTERYSPRRLEFKDFNLSQTVSSKITPVRITIPSLNIDNGIYPARIDNGKWEATKEGVSYLSSSPVPGSAGNSILYGHNFQSILGNLTKIKPGDKIEILMSDGEKKIFKVKFTSVVDPDQTHILSQTADNRITLYTCTGFLDSKRFVATATLVNPAPTTLGSGH